MQIINRQQRHLEPQYFDVFCKKCGSQLRFSQNEIKTSIVRWWGWPSTKRFINCAVCDNLIDSQYFIPYPPPSGGGTERPKPPPSHND